MALLAVALAIALCCILPCIAASWAKGEAIWSPQGLQAKHVLLRPKSWTIPKDSNEPKRMTVLVSAAPDVKNGGKVLALYKLFVNGIFVGIGPGRGEGPVSQSAHVGVYDTIEVPQVVLAASTNEEISVALQVSMQISRRAIHYQ